MKMKKINFRLNLYLKAQNCRGKKINETENAPSNLQVKQAAPATTGSEGFFQSAVGPLDYPICLRVVRGRGVHQGAHGLEGAGEGAAGELEPTVSNHISWNAEPADPVGEEGPGDRVGVDGGEEHRF